MPAHPTKQYGGADRNPALPLFLLESALQKSPPKPAKNDFGDVRNKSHLLGIAEMAWFPEKAPGSPYHKPAPADDVPISLSWLTLQIFDEANDAPRL